MFVNPLSYVNKVINSICKLELMVSDDRANNRFPSELQLAKVVPIFKATNNNYEQQANFFLSLFSKVFEKIIYNHLTYIMDQNNILYSYQFGFRQHTLLNKPSSLLLTQLHHL